MFEQQISNGVALLNERVPGWAQKVDVRKLDMRVACFSATASTCGCVGAQLDAAKKGGEGSFGYFVAETLNFRAPYQSSYDCGLNIQNVEITERDDLWRQLTCEWRWTIATLQGYRGPR